MRTRWKGVKKSKKFADVINGSPLMQIMITHKLIFKSQFLLISTHLYCQATMLAHVSPDPAHYSETLHTVQLASRLHRMRRKRLKSGNGSTGSGSSDEHRRLSKMRSRSAGNPR